MPEIAQPDPTALLDTLDPDRIVQRLQELDAESRALRAARTRQRGRQPAVPVAEDRHAG